MSGCGQFRSLFNDPESYPPYNWTRSMARKSNTKWSQEDDRRLLELRAAGKSVLSIGLMLRRSSSAIEGRLGVLKAKERGIKSEQLMANGAAADD